MSGLLWCLIISKIQYVDLFFFSNEVFEFTSSLTLGEGLDTLIMFIFKIYKRIGVTNGIFIYEFER